MALRAVVVSITIADLAGFTDNYPKFAEYVHAAQVQVIVIPDKKTRGASCWQCEEVRKNCLPVLPWPPYEWEPSPADPREFPYDSQRPHFEIYSQSHEALLRINAGMWRHAPDFRGFREMSAL